MHGELSVESTIGKGSTFKVRIPGIAADETGNGPAAALSCGFIAAEAETVRLTV